MKNIVGKTVLLSGASGGIGAFIVRALAKEKVTIIGVSRSAEKLNKIRGEIDNFGGRFISIPFDITNLEALPILIERVEQLVGSVDILINNAAVEKYRPFQNYSSQDIEAMITTNLVAPMELTRLVLPTMLERNSGHIVNISSGSGKKGAPYNSIYSATKAGLIIWTDAIRQELVNTKVGTSVICPGYTNAGMFHAFGLPSPHLARVAQPQEVAKAVIFAIKKNKPEIMLDGFLTRLLFAYVQIEPEFGDKIYRWIGLTKLNKTCVENQIIAENMTEES